MTLSVLLLELVVTKANPFTLCSSVFDEINDDDLSSLDKQSSYSCRVIDVGRLPTYILASFFIMISYLK
jgi:hypothetical protein